MKCTGAYPKQRWIFHMGLVALVLWLVGCATPSSAPPTSRESVEGLASTAPKQLEDIRVQDQDTFLDVVMVGSEPMAYTAFKAIDPLRLVVDLSNTAGEDIASPIRVENEIIGTIETLMLTQEPRAMTRVEIGLNREVPYTISQDESRIRVRFEKTGLLSETAPAEPTAEPEAELTAREITAAEPLAEEAGPAEALRHKPLPPANKIVALEPEITDEQTRVAIVADGKLPHYNVMALKKPARLVVDITGVQSALDKAKYPVAGPLVERIRCGSHPNKLRVVFDLVPAAGLPYQVVPENGRLLVSFRPGPGFSRAETGAPAQVAAERQKAARINAIDFALLDSGKSRLAVSADRALDPEIQITGARSISLILPNSHLPEHLQRHIDTGQFASAVNLIDPRPMSGVPDAVEIGIELREMVPYHAARADKTIHLDFDPSNMPPPEPIQLEKPATVVEARAPARPAVAKEPGRPAEARQLTEEMTHVLGAEPFPLFEERKVYTGKPISLDFHDVDIRNVLRLIANITGKNIVVEPDVKGRVTLKVVDVPWDQVLDLILGMNKLGMVVEGNVMRIATAEKLKTERRNKIEAIKAEKERLAEAKDLGEITTEYLQVNYADAKSLRDKIELNKSAQGSIDVDERTNMIIYSDFPARLANAREMLDRLDRPTPQVMIEARIVEASTNFSRDLGIQWGGSYTARELSDELGGDLTFQGLLGGENFAVSAPVGAIGSLGIAFSRIGGSPLELDVRLSSLETSGEGRIIASPRIFTLDNVEATIEQGKDIPVPVQTEDGISTEYKTAALTLKVTPHITPDEKVRLEVEAEKNEPDFGQVVNDVPAITRRSAQTELLVNSGDTIVIGGVVTQDRSWTEERVPFFSSLPVLKWLFKSRLVRDDKTELLIFLSPSIVKERQYARQ
ncbi:MAG: type IV pilus secretin PilQ [Syntrophobacteria bacterium]